MGLHSEGLNIISEGYLRLRFFFLVGGGVGGRGEAYFWEGLFSRGWWGLLYFTVFSCEDLC